jgi:histidine ammonia-lyase
MSRTAPAAPEGGDRLAFVAQRTAIRLTGEDLALADVWEVAHGRAAAALSPDAQTKMGAARRLVERAAHGASEHTYGVNTGFGRFVSKSIPEELTEELQLRLLRSHACGVGEPYPPEVVRAAMLLRANALAKGYSGARIETVELLLECLNRGLLPHVPARGSVGASGDLAPLAHLALPLVGEGEASIDGERMPGAESLARVGLEPVRLQAKEGLSLINGTQFMTAQAALGLVRARRLAKTADLACALSLEALQGSRASFLPQIHALRPLRGQAASAANVLRLLDGSTIIEAHRWCDRVQDAYSLRCAPQVHGASRDLLDYIEYTVAIELNAATDNPLVLVDDDMLVSNGNFHGQPLAFGLDTLAMAVAELANISERRVERLVNPSLSEGLPAFLTPDGGLNSGFMIPQYVAASLVSENKSLCHPASVDSIPTSAGQEDHVSMGNAAGLKAWQVLANSERALAIELLAAAQAVEFLAPLEPGLGSRATRELVRTLSPRLRDDRPLAADIERTAEAIRDGSLVAAVESEVGELA